MAKVQVILKAEPYTSKDGVEGLPYHPIDLEEDEAATLIKSGMAMPSENGEEIAKVEPTADGKGIVTSYEILNPPKTVEDVINLHVDKPLAGSEEVPKPDEETGQYKSEDVDNMVKSVVGYVPHLAHETSVVTQEQIEETGSVPKPQDIPSEETDDGHRMPTESERDPKPDDELDLKKLEAGNSTTASHANKAENKAKIEGDNKHVETPAQKRSREK
jgi:hypothetical protein